MSEESIKLLSTGIPGLDQVLGGGVPEASMSLIAGGPGTGKTTLVQQILFANASTERPAIYFTIQGEHPLNMLRYLRRRGFFDAGKFDTAIRFVNLDQELKQGNLGGLQEAILRWVDEVQPSFLAIDSFRAVLRATAGSGDKELRDFLIELSTQLTVRFITSFLVGEYTEQGQMQESPIFSMADNILWMCQSTERNSMVRKLHVVKMRGLDPMIGLHTYRTMAEGLEIFPRIPVWMTAVPPVVPQARVSTGIADLDEMAGGGIPEGDAVLVAGASGTGKSIIASRFMEEGLDRGEPGVIAVFEEHPREYLSRARGLGIDLERWVEGSRLQVLYLRPLDLSVDETLREIAEAVQRLGARRVVIDSVSGFELALAPTFREDFRESLYRLVSALTRLGVTILMTVEMVEDYTELRFTPQLISFLADDIILLRYVEMEGQFRRVMAVAKMRGSQHSKYMRLYEITQDGIVVGDTLEQYRSILTGMPLPARRGAPEYPGLTTREANALRALERLGEGTLDRLLEATGLPRQRLVRALSRLVDLGYASRGKADGETVYRPV